MSKKAAVIVDIRFGTKKNNVTLYQEVQARIAYKKSFTNEIMMETDWLIMVIVIYNGNGNWKLFVMEIGGYVYFTCLRFFVDLISRIMES